MVSVEEFLRNYTLKPQISTQKSEERAKHELSPKVRLINVDMIDSGIGSSDSEFDVTDPMCSTERTEQFQHDDGRAATIDLKQRKRPAPNTPVPFADVEDDHNLTAVSPDEVYRVLLFTCAHAAGSLARSAFLLNNARMWLAP